MIGLLSINHSVKTKDKKTPGRRGEWTESSGHFYGRLRAVQGIRGLLYTGGYGRFRGEWAIFIHGNIISTYTLAFKILAVIHKVSDLNSVKKKTNITCQQLSRQYLSLD